MYHALKQLEMLLSQGKINRREFLTRAAAIGFTATMAPMLWTKTAHSGPPHKGGRLRIGISDASISDSLAPDLTETDMMKNLSWQLRNNLVEVGPNGELIPELAESWEPTPDFATWRFKLRQGVEFHNGKTLDAQDVIFSINIHRGAESKSPAKSLVKQIKDIKADGKDAIAFTLNQPNLDFPAILTVFSLQIVINNTKDYGIGTGGYILENFNPGTHSLAKRNPNYWKEGRAHFDEVETIAIKDSVARTSALTTGQIDVMDKCDLKTIHLLEKMPGIHISNVSSRRHHYFAMRTDKAPFDNNDVRLAMKYAIDREAVIKLTMRGYGTIGNDHPIGPPYPFHATEADFPQRQYDPDKAKFHMKKAGMESHTFKLHTSEVPWTQAVDTALLYQEHAAKAGIKIEVVKEPSDGFWDNVWMKKDFFASRWSGRQTEDMMLTLAYSDESNWNDTYWKNKKFNQLLKAARVEKDKARRREMYVEMQKIIHEEGGSVGIAFANMVDAASKKLKFNKVSSQHDLDGHRCAERWWFA